jgi:hypothetical protein
MDDSQRSVLEHLTGRAVVLDVRSTYVIVGTLIGQDHRYLILEDADVHDLRDSASTREMYVVEIKRHGVGSNRKRVLVSRDEIVSVSALDDVVE